MHFFRFSLAGFLVFAGLTGAGAGYWMQQQREAEAALRNLQQTEAAFELGVSPIDYVAASRRVVYEECDVPFADEERSVSSHLQRMDDWLQLFCNQFESADQIRPFLHEAVEWERQGFPSGDRETGSRLSIACRRDTVLRPRRTRRPTRGGLDAGSEQRLAANAHPRRRTCRPEAGKRKAKRMPRPWPPESRWG